MKKNGSKLMPVVMKMEFKNYLHGEPLESEGGIQ